MSDDSFQKSLGHVFVIGGCGFLGSHIVELLLERHTDSKVTILDLRDSPRRVKESTTFLPCDITNAQEVENIFIKYRPDVVIHTASPVAIGIPEKVMLKVNVDGTNVLLKAARESGVRAFVYTSSASVITGIQDEYINADERWPVVLGSDQPEYYTHTKVRLLSLYDYICKPSFLEKTNRTDTL